MFSTVQFILNFTGYNTEVNTEKLAFIFKYPYSALHTMI